MRKLIFPLIFLLMVMYAVPIYAADMNVPLTIDSSTGVQDPQYIVDTDYSTNTVALFGNNGFAIMKLSQPIPKGNLVKGKAYLRQHSSCTTSAVVTALDSNKNDLGALFPTFTPTTAAEVYSKSNTFADDVYYLKMSNNSNCTLYVFYLTVAFDYVPPAAPTSLAAQPLESAINLTWGAVATAKSYNVYQDGTKVNQSQITATNYKVTGLTNGKTYSFAVSSVDVMGIESSKSASVFAAPIEPDTTPPPVPTELIGVGRDTKVELAWNGVIANDLAGYNVYKDGVKLNTSLITLTSYSVSGLTNGTVYKFEVTSVDFSGNESAKSNAVNVTPTEIKTDPPQVPIGLSGTYGDKTVNLYWLRGHDPDLAGYNVYMDGVKINTSLVAATSYAVTGLDNGTTYVFTVRAVDTSGNESADSESFHGKPAPNSIPIFVLYFQLLDVAKGIASMFDTTWLILAFAIAIPLAFYIAFQIKRLFVQN